MNWYKREAFPSPAGRVDMQSAPPVFSQTQVFNTGGVCMSIQPVSLSQVEPLQPPSPLTPEPLQPTSKRAWATSSGVPPGSSPKWRLWRRIG